jgi:hypothetical protein
MKRYISRVRQPVKRQRAEYLVLLTLVSFAVTVAGTRWYLEVTGYPKIGTSTLHIAHVLWGGLLLFVAALLPLVLANREVYPIAAILSGAGVGLFIDEVGKFITTTNDYFYPAAAPIIYAFFLLTVLVYVQIRRPPSQDARAEMYRALEELSEVLDHDLEPHERLALMRRLRSVAAQSEQPELARLARELLDFVVADSVVVVPIGPAWVRRTAQAVEWWADVWLPRRTARLALGMALVVAGLPGAWTLALLSQLPREPSAVMSRVTADLSTIGPNRLPTLATDNVMGAAAYLMLVAAAAVPLLVSGALLIVGQERLGLALAYFALLLDLTMIYLLLFYFQQFHAVSGVTIAFVLLLMVVYYRRRFGLSPPAERLGAVPAAGGGHR